METLTWFESSAVPPEQLGPLLTEYVTLDRLRTVRRLLLVRCGGLALTAATVGPLISNLSVVARMLAVALCLIPPFGAWIMEHRADQRLADRLQSLSTTTVSGGAQPK